MASIPLPALGIRPPEQPDLMGSAAKMMSLRDLMQRGQIQQQAIQQNQMDLDSQKALMKAYTEAEGDPEKTTKLAAKYKVKPQALLQWQNSVIEQKQKTLDLVMKQGDVAKQQADLMQGAHDAVTAAKPEQKPMVYQQQRTLLGQRGIDVSQMPPDYPGDEPFKFIGAVVKSHAQQVEEALKQAQNTREAAQAAETARHNQAVETAPPPEEKEFQAFYKSKLAAEGQQPNAKLEIEARQEFYKRKQNPATVVNATNARADRSYQYENGQLDKVQEPIQQAVARLGRLQDTLAQNSPQADALVAPELLTVMAGGQGSGLRMNEAEIARIVGGRSKLQSLEASINKWKLDPSAARSITSEQQAQIHSLVSVVQQKLLAKQNIIEGARQALINSNDPAEHRKITADARKKLSDIDMGVGGGGGFSVTAPNGKTYNFKDQASLDAFKKAAGIQ